MRNKYGAVEISIGTLVIIVIAMAILILGLTLMKDVRNRESQFSVYKEECRNKSVELTNSEKFSLLGEIKQSLIIRNYLLSALEVNECYIVNEKKQYNKSRCDDLWQIYNHVKFIEPQFYEYRNIEVCEEIEVDEIIFEIDIEELNVPFGNVIFSFIVEKQDISIDWLSNNAECVKLCSSDSNYCPNIDVLMEDLNVRFIGELTEEYGYVCSQWKIQNYLIERNS